MNSIDKLFKLAEHFARKISLAQAQSAQPGDIDNALSQAGARPTSNDIAPLLTTAKVPEDVSVDVKAVVDKNLNVRFHVAATPANPAANSLQAILDRTYSTKMSHALKSAKLMVENPITVNIATFSA